MKAIYRHGYDKGCIIYIQDIKVVEKPNAPNLCERYNLLVSFIDEKGQFHTENVQEIKREFGMLVLFNSENW